MKIGKNWDSTFKKKDSNSIFHTIAFLVKKNNIYFLEEIYLIDSNISLFFILNFVGMIDLTGFAQLSEA
jgi:hypothetical protein